jgi:hypothetical protein
MVAYTPDPEAGEADKQVRTTMSKLLRKFFPSLSDSTIRDIDAAHRADLLGELELISGPDIAEAYQQKGPHSCMSYKRGNWNGIGAFHPCDAYNAPGFSLAVMRNSKGEISARSLTWINPDDPGDKRYVRVYGDTALKRRLERNGYVAAGFAGARLKKIQMPSNTDDPDTVLFVAPYLDGVHGSPGGKHDGRYVVPDGEWLRIVDTETASNINKVVSDSAQLTNANGYVRISRSAIKALRELEKPCPITGLPISILDRSCTPVWYGGEYTLVHRSAVPEGSPAFLGYSSPDYYMWLPILQAEGHETKTFVHDARMLIDNKYTREAFGYVMLSPKYYPDAGWVLKGEGGVSVHKTRDGEHILESDAVYLIYMADNGDADYTVVHKTDPVLEKAKKIHRLSKKLPTYAMPDVKTVTTRSGFEVVPRLYNVAQLYDGSWVFRRLVVRKHFFGVPVLTVFDEPMVLANASQSVKDAIVNDFAGAFRMLTPKNENTIKAQALSCIQHRVYGRLPAKIDEHGLVAVERMDLYGFTRIPSVAESCARRFDAVVAAAGDPDAWKATIELSSDNDPENVRTFVLMVNEYVQKQLAELPKPVVHDERFVLAA